MINSSKTIESVVESVLELERLLGAELCAKLKKPEFGVPGIPLKSAIRVADYFPKKKEDRKS
jgi:hypothetical protein